VTTTPMTSSSTVVSISVRRVMVNRSYGWVRQKSNHTASTPASRYPFAATATTTSSMASAASVFGKPPRNGTSTAASPSGATSAASTARRSRVRYPAIEGTSRGITAAHARA
jgi:hypothetical protein